VSGIRTPLDSRVGRTLERVTPRIDAQSRCHCSAAITWDEVYGWLHAAGAEPDCHRPAPGHSTMT